MYNSTIKISNAALSEDELMIIENSNKFQESNVSGCKIVTAKEKANMEEDMTIGRKKAMEEIAIELLRSKWLNKEQISEITKLDKKKLDELEK